MTPPADDEPSKRPQAQPGTIRLGTIAGIDVRVAHSWFLIVALLAILMAPALQSRQPSLGALAYLAGVAFAVLLYASVLLHEISHALAARGFGMHVSSINLHFLGGATEIEGEASTPWREFVIAVVGPLTSLAVGALGWWLQGWFENGLLWFVIAALALANLVVGALNLVPGLPLDGGRVLQAAVWAVSSRRSLGVIVAAWGGRIAAVAAVLTPVLLLPALDRQPDIFDYLFGFMIAAFLWSGATQSLAMTKFRDKLPLLQGRRLARAAIGVPADLPLAEAIRRAQEANAGSLVVVTSDGRPSGIVNEEAVRSTPTERQPWLPCGDLARRLEDGLMLSADLTGEHLLRAMQHTPATEYVLLEPNGSIFGVLVAKDVDAAFRAA
ncbi:MAG: M50 family metallopeptidase [Nocardioidaceae bacterium]